MSKHEKLIYKPFFETKDEYDAFVETMKTAAEEGKLPIAFQHSEPDMLSVQDIKQFSQKFMKDTGLHIEFRLFTCSHCERLHCVISVEEGDPDDWN